GKRDTWPFSAPIAAVGEGRRYSPHRRFNMVRSGATVIGTGRGLGDTEIAATVTEGAPAPPCPLLNRRRREMIDMSALSDRLLPVIQDQMAAQGIPEIGRA